MHLQSVFESLKEINREGTTILVVEQNARMALQFGGRGYLLENGRVMLEGRSEELLADPGSRKRISGGDRREKCHRSSCPCGGDGILGKPNL
jgi:branched-chain amino acid transport system ATP-binding protein